MGLLFSIVDVLLRVDAFSAMAESYGRRLRIVLFTAIAPHTFLRGVTLDRSLECLDSIGQALMCRFRLRSLQIKAPNQ